MILTIIMKKLLIIIFCFLGFSGLLTGQMITTDPAVPTTGKIIKIYYDSSKDAGDLHNFTGDLYAHTGVTLLDIPWQKVIGTWANNSTQPKLTYLGTYRYELDITPDIKTFYSLSGTDVANKNLPGNTQFCRNSTNQTRYFSECLSARTECNIYTSGQDLHLLLNYINKYQSVLPLHLQILFHCI